MKHCSCCLIGTLEPTQDVISLSSDRGDTAFIEGVPARICTFCGVQSVCLQTQTELRIALQYLEERRLAPKSGYYLVLPGVIKVNHSCPL